MRTHLISRKPGLVTYSYHFHDTAGLDTGSAFLPRKHTSSFLRKRSGDLTVKEHYFAWNPIIGEGNELPPYLRFRSVGI